MFDWPMSSPQMMTMFGFRGCCACTSADANTGTASVNATNACFHLMEHFHFFVSVVSSRQRNQKAVCAVSCATVKPS